MSALDWILQPVCKSHHWLLMVIDVKQRLVHVLDSLPQKERRNECFDLWMTFLRNRKQVETNSGDLPVKGWRLGHLKSECQEGSNDCGVYVCKNGESMVTQGHPAQDVHVPAARKHIYMTIVAHGHIA